MRPIYNKSLFQVAGFVWMLARLTTAGCKGSLWCQTQNSHPRLAGVFVEPRYTYFITQLGPGHGSCCRERKKEKEKELLLLRVIYTAVLSKEESLIDDFIRFN